jgi:hypothetical protein
MHRYTVEFRIEGAALVPADVSAKLGLEPCQVREGVARRNALWSYDGAAESTQRKEWESLEEGLLYLLERLLPKQGVIQANFGGFDMYWWCGHFQQSFDGGPTLSPELFRKLADFGVPLILDNYFSDEDKK